TVRHVVGIDSSPIRAARTGIRGGNDIVWVGRAANHAAKLTDLDLAPSTWITDEVFIRLADELKYGGTPPTLMWEAFRWNRQGGRRIHGSDWAWRV
ncbi:adenylate/guanylate cyclase domain-containing protein, partial [Stenotrophomonas maltophilia]|nr:adenylate/guanylate cyclase domain-containing protein [Stenotrophomonas maltophilia]